MLWFHEVKGHGFIRTDEGERLYVEREGFVAGAAPVGRCAGLRVEFRIDERQGARVAVDVSLVSAGASAGRARRRSASMRSR
jgi:cold shock CspA family protein